MFGSKKKKKAQEQKENAMLYRKAMEQEEQEEQKARLMELREKVNTFSLPSICIFQNFAAPSLTCYFCSLYLLGHTYRETPLQPRQNSSKQTWLR